MSESRATEYYTVELYRRRVGEDLVLPHDSEQAARAYLQQLAKLWRGEGLLVSCAASETEPARVTGQEFNKTGVMFIARQAWILTWSQNKSGVLSA